MSYFNPMRYGYMLFSMRERFQESYLILEKILKIKEK